MGQVTLRGGGLILTAILTLVAAPSAQAQPRDAQARVMARRAATVDAYRQLIEQVKGLQLDSQTYVRDFVAESDVIATELDNFLKGGRITDTRFYEDGTCEVDVEVTVEDLEEELHKIVRERWTLAGWKRQPPEVEVHSYYTRRTIVATGSSAVQAKEASPGTEPAVSTAPWPSPTRGTAEHHPDWAGVSARQKLMARRGAQLDAYRQLLERVKGLQLNSSTYVRDFVAESDVIATELNEYLRGARVVVTRYVAGPICEVEVEVAVQDFDQQMERIVRRHARHTDVIIHSHDYFADDVLHAVGMAVPGGDPVIRDTADVAAEPEWSEQSVMATGYGVAPQDAASIAEGRLLAERAAEIDAKRQLLERIGDVRVDASTSVRDFMADSDTVRATIDGVVRGARRIDTRYNSDGTIEVDVEAPLDRVWTVVRDGG